MFDYSFGKTIYRDPNSEICKVNKMISQIHKMSILRWEEHCVECSIPFCYTSCEIYTRRGDGACVRLNSAIVKDKNYNGAYTFGLNCEFKKWAKIETHYHPIPATLRFNLFITKVDNLLTKFFERLSFGLKFVSPRMKLLRGYRRFASSLLRSSIIQTQNWKPDIFYIECYLINKEKAQILVQIENKDAINYTRIFTINKGKNEIRIPFNEISNGNLNSKNRLFIATLEETLTNIIFTWIDFIKLKKVEIEPAKTLKCLAWDLDNTLWKGVLTEDGLENIELNKSAVEVIKKLDQRGVLNTIVSKNNHEEAFEALQKFEIDEYFLYPAINWGQKSENLKNIALKLNIGIDTFGFVDDNIREREEVRLNLGCVRVYSDLEIDKLLDYKEFNVPVTDVSRMRRQSYMIDSSRKEFKSFYNENYDDYLKALEMKLSVEKLSNTNYDRSYELLARSNQLNLTTNKYSKEEFEALSKDNSFLCYAYKCIDKFGDYGQIGFISLKINDKDAQINDLVISCRIAKKKVENAMIFALKHILILHGIKKLEACLIKTKRNGPLSSVFNELPFQVIENTNEKTIYVIENIGTLEDENILNITYE